MKKMSGVQKILAAAMAGTMCLLAAGMGVCAEDVAPNHCPPSQTVLLTKTLTLDAHVTSPNTTFEFQISPTQLGEGAVTKEGVPVYSGITGGAYFAKGAETIKFAPGDAISKSTQITLNSAVFTKPGVYRYDIAEKSGTYDGMTYVTDISNLDLYVENQKGGLKITAAIVTKCNEKQEKLEFLNKYDTNDLSLKKVIKGNQADLNAKFRFQILINGAEGEQYTTDRKGLTLTSGTPVTVSLGNNETLNIYGLSANDQYTIIETDANKDGYVTTYKLNGKDAAEISGIKAGGADQCVIVTNKKDITTPTGIVTSMLPSILFVVIAGMFAVLFFAKKKER